MVATNNKNLVIVGNGMASHALCARLTTDSDVAQKFTIRVVGNERRPAYDRVRMTDFFTGATPEQLQLATREWYESRGIALQTGTTITSIDRQQHLLQTDEGTTIPYDLVVLATGSRPFIPPIPGVDLEGVFPYRTIEDLQQISQAGKKSRTAAVLGGGLLGLEAAKALYEMQLLTHVVEVAPSLMPRQLDREAGDELRHRIERMGIRVHVAKRATSIERHGDFLIVCFATGETIAVDMIVISAGIRPRDELAHAVALQIGDRGGIVVDDQLRTSDPDIYAIGECACHRGVVYGLVNPCYQMARVLADHLQGRKSRFTGADQSAKLKLLGVDVATFGEPIGQATGAYVLRGHATNGCRKLLLRDQRIVGAIGVGEWPEANLVQSLIYESKRAWGWQIRRFQKTGSLLPPGLSDHVSRWPPEAIVCGCMKVTRSQLSSAYQQGCATFESLSASTGAATVCGSCRPLLNQILGGELVAGENNPRMRVLGVISCLVLFTIMLFPLSGPIRLAESVTDPRRILDELWRDNFWKQVTGYSLVVITILAMLLSLRKRWSRLRFGNFGMWRGAHAFLGLLSLGGVVLHTGLHLGSNVNLWLVSTFIGLNLLGGFTGFITSVEARAKPETALWIRQWRPRMTLLHILLVWPLPVLIAVHVFCVYYY